MLSLCLINLPRFLMCLHLYKAGDDTPFLHPSRAGSHGSCPAYLTILALGLPFAPVASFVTCQLIRPRRHITSVGRQQGLEQLQFLFFLEKATRCLLSLIQRDLMAASACSQQNSICKSPNSVISLIPQQAQVSTWGPDFSCFSPNIVTDINRGGLPLMPHCRIPWQLEHFAKF